MDVSSSNWNAHACGVKHYSDRVPWLAHDLEIIHRIKEWINNYDCMHSLAYALGPGVASTPLSAEECGGWSQARATPPFRQRLTCISDATSWNDQAHLQGYTRNWDRPGVFRHWELWRGDLPSHGCALSLPRSFDCRVSFHSATAEKLYSVYKKKSTMQQNYTMPSMYSSKVGATLLSWSGECEWKDHHVRSLIWN